MGYKNDDRCLDNVGEDEPIFVLRANDELAPDVVRHWVQLSLEHGLHTSKVEEAERWADVMEQWKHAQQEQDAAPAHQA